MNSDHYEPWQKRQVPYHENDILREIKKIRCHDENEGNKWKVQNDSSTKYCQQFKICFICNHMIPFPCCHFVIYVSNHRKPHNVFETCQFQTFGLSLGLKADELRWDDARKRQHLLPLCFAIGLWKHVVLPFQVHDPVFEVKFPLIFVAIYLNKAKHQKHQKICFASKYNFLPV